MPSKKRTTKTEIKRQIDKKTVKKKILGCVSKVESMTAERKNLQNQKEIRAECRIFLYTK